VSRKHKAHPRLRIARQSVAAVALGGGSNSAAGPAGRCGPSGGRLPSRGDRGTLLRPAGRRCASCPGLGCPDGASDIRAGSDGGVRPSHVRRPRQVEQHRPSGSRCFRHARRDSRGRCADGRSVRLRPSGRLRQWPVSGSGAEPRPVSGRHCPPRTLPQPCAVCCYRKRSPGRRPLVGCSHRQYACPTCWASRWRSCSRT
jgi:hypothetical protein